MRPAPLFALLVLASASACSHLHGRPSTALESDGLRVGDAVFHVRYHPEDAAIARQVEGALGGAVRAAERWGRLSAPVLVTIHPTHESFEAATHREGHPWLRGWARYAAVDLQSPRTWSTGAASDAQVVQILAHELTHCVVYQSIARESNWRDIALPLWFQEGMASVSAGQEFRGVRVELVGRVRYVPAAGGAGMAAGPLTGAEPESDLAYGIADAAFRFLLARHGEKRVLDLIARMRQGLGFEEAFRRAMGIPLREFESEFRRDVRGFMDPWVRPAPRR